MHILADDFELGIDIISIKFTHHHLFTKEHVIASRLQASCLEYVKREKEAIAAHLEDKVSSLVMYLYYTCYHSCML